MFDSNIMSTTIIGFLVGVLGTGMGGVLALLLINPNKRFLSMLLGATSGIMLAVVTFDLLPEAFNMGGLWVEILGIIIGIIIIVLIEDIIPYKRLGGNRRDGFTKTGILLGIGIALHNLPEGLAIGSGFMVTKEMGLAMALVIALHDLPEGIAMATPLRLGGASRLKVIILTLLSGVPTGIGAFIGAVLGSVSDFFVALCLSFAGGTMLYITCGELIPNSKALHHGRASTIGLIFGFILGIIITFKL